MSNMNERAQIDRLCELFVQTVNRYNRLEKEMHAYGAKQGLHLSETHTIVDIGAHEDLNITKLARIQGVSKSAASQMVSKLVKKGFVQKEFSPETENEVVLSLTESGKKIRQEHEKQHIWLRNHLADILANHPDSTIETLIALAAEIQKLWDSLPHQPGLV